MVDEKILRRRRRRGPTDIRVRNRRPPLATRLPAEEKIKKKTTADWDDQENHAALLSRVNSFNLGSNVGDEALRGSDSSPDLSKIRGSRYEEQLKRFVRDDLKQLLCDLKNTPKPTPETVCRNQSQLALEFFKNEIKGGDYEYVSCGNVIPTSLFVTHTNFYARLRGADSPPEFFFAVLENGCPPQATHCCKLDQDGNETLQPGEVVRHCKHVNCSACARWSGYDIRPGEDVIM